MSHSNHAEPPGLKKWLRVFYISCALLLLVDFIPIFHHSDAEYLGWETPWGFYGIYGFTACVALVVAAKLLRKLVMRIESYYDES